MTLLRIVILRAGTRLTQHFCRRTTTQTTMKPRKWTRTPRRLQQIAIQVIQTRDVISLREIGNWSWLVNTYSLSTFRDFPDHGRAVMVDTVNFSTENVSVAGFVVTEGNLQGE